VTAPDAVSSSASAVLDAVKARLSQPVGIHPRVSVDEQRHEAR